jgi:hypothetical protein
LSFVVVILSFELRADDGRDFAGFYELTEPGDMESEVSVTFTVDVFNYRGEDCYDATLTLGDPFLPGEAWGTFYTAYIEDRDGVRVSGEVVVPAHEYQRWQQGAMPHLSIDYQSAAGERFRSTVELVRMPLGEEE